MNNSYPCTGDVNETPTVYKAGSSALPNSDHCRLGSAGSERDYVMQHTPNVPEKNKSVSARARQSPLAVRRSFSWIFISSDIHFVVHEVL